MVFDIFHNNSLYNSRNEAVYSKDQIKNQIMQIYRAKAIPLDSALGDRSCCGVG